MVRMLAKCANPECQSQFHYLHEGRLFCFECACTKPDSGKLEKKMPRGVEFFWLCNHCYAEMTMECRPDQGVMLKPKSTKPVVIRDHLRMAG